MILTHKRCKTPWVSGHTRILFHLPSCFTQDVHPSGSGDFWVSLYNPNLVSCDSAIDCEGKLRSAYGQIFSSSSLSAEFQIMPKRCIRLIINALVTKFESVECDLNITSACESTCAIGTPGKKIKGYTV